MRRPILVGNWKMNQTKAEVKAFVEAFDFSTFATENDLSQIDFGISSVAHHLPFLSKSFSGTPLKVGPQNCCPEFSGAFTGEIGLAHVVDEAWDFVILGHSERRSLYGENSEAVAKKAKALLDLNASHKTNVLPIVCVGESLEERKSGMAEEIVLKQLRASLSGLTGSEVARCVVAYEPVWAIGTGETATPAQAQEMHALIRSCVAETWDIGTSEALRIQYGGSVKPANVKELMSCLDVDGALVGGASIKADSFKELLVGAKEQLAQA